MRSKSFTLVEVIVVVIIIGVLATLGIPAYQRYIEEADAEVCSANLRALQQALDIYAMEHDRMPGDLSQLPGEYINRGYAKVRQEKGAWKIKLASFIINWQEHGLAYAGLGPAGTRFLKDDIAKGNIGLITCRKASGDNSYGVYVAPGGLQLNMTSADYRNIPGGTILIADSDSSTFDDFSDISDRHKATRQMGAIAPGQRFGLGIGRGGVNHPPRLHNCSHGQCSPFYTTSATAGSNESDSY